MGSPGTKLHCPKNLCFLLAFSGAEGECFSGKHVSWSPTWVLGPFQNTFYGMAHAISEDGGMERADLSL